MRIENFEDLSKKNQWALENEKLMKAKSEKAYEILKLNHQWKDIAKEDKKLYQSLIEEQD